jgi:hypothetical protein
MGSIEPNTGAPTYNRAKRRELLKVLQRRRSILLNSKLIADKSYQQLSQEEFTELQEGKCTEAERQAGFNKVRKILGELFFIDTKINEITVDLSNKYKKQNARKTTSNKDARP